MDSITQAALGALCGELILSKKLGWKGAAWGLLFGTIPDLDIIAYAWLDFIEQLRWHRGISHSLVILPFASVFFGWIISMIHKEKGVSFKRAAWFVFMAWSTHILIDCFNTYGTQIFEPFSDYRFALNNISIIDGFFLLPMLLGLIICVFFCKTKPRFRSFIGWSTASWLCVYFVASLTMKFIAERHFSDKFNAWGVTPNKVMTAPSFSNIFLWRGVAQDDEKYYVSYWSIFDAKDREYTIREFEHGKNDPKLVKGFKKSEELKALKWFSKGWHRLYKLEGEPDTLYVAAMMISETHLGEGKDAELRPSFLWKITKVDGSYEVGRAIKMSKDMWKSKNFKKMGKAISNLTDRVKGGQPDWMKGQWTWDKEPEAESHGVANQAKKNEKQ